MFASQYNERNLDDFLTARQLLEISRRWMRPRKRLEDLDDREIGDLIRWLGMISADTVYTQDDTPHIRRWGINLMLSVALLAFPEFYTKHELWQVN